MKPRAARRTGDCAVMDLRMVHPQQLNRPLISVLTSHSSSSSLSSSTALFKEQTPFPMPFVGFGSWGRQALVEVAAELKKEDEASVDETPFVQASPRLELPESLNGSPMKFNLLSRPRSASHSASNSIDASSSIHSQTPETPQLSLPKETDLPPATPTRSLLQRIQRRSSTSVEAVLGNKGPGSIVCTSTGGILPRSSIPPSMISTPTTGRTSKPPSTASSTHSSLPVHRRNLSLLPRSRSGGATVASTMGSPLSKPAQPRLPSTLSKALAGQTPSSAREAGKVAATSEGTPLRRHSLLGRSRSFLHLAGQKEADAAITETETATFVPDVPEKDASAIATTAATPASLSKKAVPTASATGRSALLLRAFNGKAHGGGGEGLTQQAAKALEEEFVSQERILQELQRDNERKTIEVEELRRYKVRLEEGCVRLFGVDSWRQMVLGEMKEASSTLNEQKEPTPSDDQRCPAFVDPSLTSGADAAMLLDELQIRKAAPSSIPTRSDLQRAEERRIFPGALTVDTSQSTVIIHDADNSTMSVGAALSQNVLLTSTYQLAVDGEDAVKRGSSSRLDESMGLDDVSFVTAGGGLAESRCNSSPPTPLSTSFPAPPIRCQGHMVEQEEKVMIPRMLLKALGEAYERVMAEAMPASTSH